LEVAYKLGELLVRSDHRVGNRWGMWKVIRHESGFIDWDWSWHRFIILLLSLSGFQWMEVLKKEVEGVIRAMPCLATAAINDLGCDRCGN
jgi:hypothetical protein